MARVEHASWICPECSRHFARDRQAHECAPAMGLDEYFSGSSERERPVFLAVLAHLETLGPMHVEPVSVGIFIKSGGSFVELRPMKRWVALSFPMAERIEDARIARKPIRCGRRLVHVVNLAGPEEVDDQLREWLSEAHVDFG